MLDFQKLNKDWDKKMNEYESNSEELVDTMKSRHVSELRDFQKKLLEKHVQPKYSKELLNLRSIQETLARNKDYAEAHKIKVKADALESFEYDKWEGLRQQEALQKYVSGPRDNLRLTFMLTIFMPCREAQFKHSKQQELLALQKRIQSGREEQKKKRHLDLERLLQQYQNAKAELEAQQNLERARMEKKDSKRSLDDFMVN